MVFKFVLNLALLSLVAGFIVPFNQTDGAYMVYEGSDTPIPISMDTSTRRTTHPRDISALQKRDLDNPEIYIVDPPIRMNAQNYHQAWLIMNDWCDSGNTLSGNVVFYTYWGDAIAYVCNYTPSTNTCIREFYQADRLIQIRDGGGDPPLAGFVHIERYFKTFGRTNKGVRICF